MLGDTTIATDIYISCGYTDMRKSIDGLAAVVQEQFCNQCGTPLNGLGTRVVRVELEYNPASLQKIVYFTGYQGRMYVTGLDYNISSNLVLGRE
jgi:hypothetical protein